METRKQKIERLKKEKKIIIPCDDDCNDFDCEDFTRIEKYREKIKQELKELEDDGRNSKN